MKIERSGLYSFDDSPYISSIFFTRSSCPEHPVDETLLGSSNTSRAEVSFDVDADKADICPLPVPDHAFTAYNSDERCGRSVVNEPFASQYDFEPRCLVVVISSESRKALFNEFLAAGRVLSDKLNITVNFTVSLGQEPSISRCQTNCMNSFIMQENHALDTVLQDELAELESARELITVYKELQIFTDDIIRRQPFRIPPRPPPPPPPAPTPKAPDLTYTGVAPAPPQQVTLEVYSQQLAAEQAKYEKRVEELLVELEGCIGTRTRTCGLTPNEAPDPWMALGGVPCAGYSTRSTRVYDYCGYFDTDISPDAADATTKNALLRIGPVCASTSGTLLSCSSNSSRTQRAGVYEMAYWMREDRAYCSHPFFRRFVN